MHIICKADIIINNYNYGMYLEECIDSVLAQSALDKINQVIIIDDGSSDHSKDILAKYKHNNLFNIVEKENAGQLSTFNLATKFIKSDIIFFLDSDDVFMPRYIEDALCYYENNSNCDYLFAHIKCFGKTNTEYRIPKAKIHHFSMMKTYYLQSFISSFTSAISIRKNVLHKILPVNELESDWVVRADDVISMGASLVGASKHFLGSTGNFYVKYRTHNENNWFNKRFDKVYCIKFELKRNRMINTILKNNNIRIDDHIIFKEYKTIDNIDFNTLKCYMMMVVNSRQLSLYQKLKTLFLMLYEYKRKKT